MRIWNPVPPPAPADEEFFLFDAKGEKFVLPGDALVAWLDETGHESYADPQHPVLGIGGCATLGADYGRVIHHPWRRMKEQHYGGADVPVHAADHQFTPPQMEAAGEFFTTGRFHRLAVFTTSKTRLDPDLVAHDVITPDLMMMLYEIAFSGPHPDPPPTRPAPLAPYPPMFRGSQVAHSMVLVFEHSQRTSALVKRHLPHAISLAEGEFLANSDLRMRRWPLPMKWGFMPKAAGAEGLEVADFVINTAGAQVRETAEEWRTTRQDFAAVFQSVGEDLAHFKRIDSFVSV